MFDITTFGARPDTGELCTQAIQAAIDAAGNGTVYIPRGEFLSGTLNLRGASLHLDKGAVLKGSPRMEDYDWNGFRHNELGNGLSLLYSLEHDDIRIDGEGTIDLNGDAFYHLDRPNLPKTDIVLTPQQIDECTRLYDARPSLPIFFYRCKHLTLEGIRVINAPCWTLTFAECRDVRALDVTVDNSLRLPNDDGMHFCCCKQVFVRGCNISAGDDCIAISCITNWEIPCEDVVISDCILRSCSKAIVIGYMHSVVRNVCICCMTSMNPFCTRSRSWVVSFSRRESKYFRAASLYRGCSSLI
jgi:polygalacturonase